MVAGVQVPLAALAFHLFIHVHCILGKFTVERIGEPGMKPDNIRRNVESPWIDVSKWPGELACGHGLRRSCL